MLGLEQISASAARAAPFTAYVQHGWLRLETGSGGGGLVRIAIRTFVPVRFKTLDILQFVPLRSAGDSSR